jgi:hypothetical protein
MAQQPYYNAAHKKVFFSWLDNLIQRAESFIPEQKFKSTQFKGELNKWLHAVIQDHDSANFDFPQLDKLNDKARGFFQLGNFYEIRASLALVCLEAKAVIESFSCAKANSKCDSFGIDIIAEMKQIRNVRRFIPFQIKASRKNGFRWLKFSKDAHYIRELQQCHPKLYKKISSLNSSLMQRFIPVIIAKQKSISKLSAIMQAHITRLAKSRVVYRTREGQNPIDQDRAPIFAELFNSGFIKPKA